jgi:uncharacterized protein affecting Mg2+/Co2+ transport/cell wall assembly regulator SMI1
MSDLLADDALLVVLSYLNFKELCLCSSTSKRFSRLATSNILWRDLLRKVWVLDVKYENMTPAPAVLQHDPFTQDKFEELRFVQQQNSITKDMDTIMHENPQTQQQCKLLFRKYYFDHPGMSGCYSRIKKLWNQLDAWLYNNAPEIYQTLQDGIPDQETCNSRFTCQSFSSQDVPIDLLCSYRIRDGQTVSHSHPTTGLFGGYSFYEYRANCLLFSAATIRHVVTQLQDRLENMCIFAGRHNVTICMVTKDTGALKRGQVIQFTRDQEPFVLAPSFTEWFERYVRLLTVDQVFEYKRGKNCEIIRYPTTSAFGSDTTTRGVRIQCNAIFIPEYSRINAREQTYFFAYRIRMSMDKSEPKSSTCQLTMRHWRTTTSTGKEERVDGEGVVGYYPVMKPGAYFEYCSCSSQPTKVSFMGGSFTMKLETTGEEFEAMIDNFELNTAIHL